MKVQRALEIIGEVVARVMLNFEDLVLAVVTQPDPFR
jgi:hypothetical protein